jgi:hypothetical protein
VNDVSCIQGVGSLLYLVKISTARHIYKWEKFKNPALFVQYIRFISRPPSKLSDKRKSSLLPCSTVETCWLLVGQHGVEFCGIRHMLKRVGDVAVRGIEIAALCSRLAYFSRRLQ